MSTKQNRNKSAKYSNQNFSREPARNPLCLLSFTLQEPYLYHEKHYTGLAG